MGRSTYVHGTCGLNEQSLETVHDRESAVNLDANLCPASWIKNSPTCIPSIVFEPNVDQAAMKFNS